MVQMIVKFCWVCLAVSFLSGCMTKPHLTTDKKLTQPVQTHFISNGKLGIRSTDLTESARFSWTQNKDQYTVELVDPFGRQVMRLSGDSNASQLRIKDKRYQAASAEALMERLLGWTLPVSHALYWVQGYPDPGVPFTSSKALQFEQSGWTVTLQDTTDLANGKTAPRKLKLHNNDLTLTLIVSKWEFPQ